MEVVDYANTIYQNQDVKNVVALRFVNMVEVNIIVKIVVV